MATVQYAGFAGLRLCRLAVLCSYANAAKHGNLR